MCFQQKSHTEIKKRVCTYCTARFHPHDLYRQMFQP